MKVLVTIDHNNLQIKVQIMIIKRSSLMLHLCLKVLTVHGYELRLFQTNTFPLSCRVSDKAIYAPLITDQTSKTL